MPKSKKTATKPAATKASGAAAASRSSSGATSSPSVQSHSAQSGGAATAKRAAGKAPGKVGAKPVAAPSPPPAAPPSDGAKRWPKGGPSKADLRRYRDQLLEMRRGLLASSRELASEALKSSGQDFSVDHMADHGSDNYEQDFSLKLLEGESEQLAEIRDALLKIDGKADLPFGLCEACSDEPQRLCEPCPWIPPSRLEVVPHARLCVQTKEIEERRKG
jgi:DnaK suppressor protein